MTRVTISHADRRCKLELCSRARLTLSAAWTLLDEDLAGNKTEAEAHFTADRHYLKRLARHFSAFSCTLTP